MDARKFSVTLSEDDLRPMKALSTADTSAPDVSISKEGSLIERLTLEHDEEEKVKNAVKREIREREEKKKREMKSATKARESSSSSSRNTGLPAKETEKDRFSYRRYNNKKYFHWDSDEGDKIDKEESETHSSTSTATEHGCELCRWAAIATEKQKKKETTTSNSKRSMYCEDVEEFKREFDLHSANSS